MPTSAMAPRACNSSCRVIQLLLYICGHIANRGLSKGNPLKLLLVS
jgi:hypothetical protein